MNKMCNIFIFLFMFLGILYLSGFAFFQIFAPELALNGSYLGFIAPFMLVSVLVIYLQMHDKLQKIIAQLFIIFLALSLAMIDVIMFYQKIGTTNIESFFNGLMFFAILGISFNIIKQTIISAEKKPE